MHNLQKHVAKANFLLSPAFSSFVYPALSMFANTCQGCAIINLLENIGMEELNMMVLNKHILVLE